MPDIIKPLSANVATQVETRADVVILRNNLDATSLLGRLRVGIDSKDEQQTADGTPVRGLDGEVIRTRNAVVEFDPMLYVQVEIPGTGRTLGAIMQDIFATVDFFKGGIPAALLPPAPEPEQAAP